MNDKFSRNIEHDTHYFENISPTAFVIAYERTFSDIPLSGEVFEAIRGIELMGEVATQDYSISRLAPRYEGRYKLVNKLLDEHSQGRILELAPGMSPRGLAYTHSDPTLKYIELDLPHISDLKKRVVQQVSKTLGQTQDSLLLVDGNALDGEVIASAAAMTGSEGQIVIINEGLMRYFNFEEKRRLSENILTVLGDRGGVWITPDITLKSFNIGAMKILETRVADISGVDLSNNYFEDIEHAIKFYDSLGFDVEVRSFLEVKDDIVSASILDIEQEELDSLLAPSVAFVLKPQN